MINGVVVINARFTTGRNCAGAEAVQAPDLHDVRQRCTAGGTKDPLAAYSATSYDARHMPYDAH